MRPHNTTNTTRQRAGHDHAGRLDELEARLLPAPRNEVHEYQQHLWELLRWASETGGRAREIAEPATDLLNEQMRLSFAALDAGEIRLGDRDPRLLTGRVHLTPEREAHWQAVDRQIADIVHTLEYMRQTAQQGRPL